MDAQGRLYPPKEVRERHGGKFHIVTYADRIELVPVADDPLVAVQAAAGELRDVEVEEIKESILETAKEEARTDSK